MRLPWIEGAVEVVSERDRRGKSERKRRALLDPIHDERIARGSAGASGKAPPLVTPSTSHGTTSSLPVSALLVVEDSTKLTELRACAARSGVGKTVIALCIGRRSWRIDAGLQTQEEECQQGNERELLEARGFGFRRWRRLGERGGQFRDSGGDSNSNSSSSSSNLVRRDNFKRTKPYTR